MKPLSQRRVLALSVHSQNFGFVVLDGPQELMDWGVRSFRGGVNTVKIPMETKLLQLFNRFRPDAVVVHGTTRPKCEKMIDTTLKLARAKRIPVKSVPWRAVQKAFLADNQNKYRIAAAIAGRHPELLPRLPSRRKAWQSEKYGIDIFEAAAISAVYFGSQSHSIKK